MLKRTLSQSVGTLAEPPQKRLRTGGDSDHPSLPVNDAVSFDTLSDELYIHIFTYLTWTDLCTVTPTSRQWSRLASDNQLWRSLYLGEYGRPRLRGAQGVPSRYKDDRELKPLPLRARPDTAVDWKWMFRISLNWRNGRCVVEKLQSTKSSSTSSLRTHIILAGPLTIMASSSRDRVPHFRILVNGSNAEHNFPCSDVSDGTTRISYVALDQSPPSVGQLVRFAAFFSDGHYRVYSISPSAIQRSFAMITSYAPPGKNTARCTPIIRAAYHHPLLVTLSASFQLSLYDLSSTESSLPIRHTQTLTSFTSFPPTSLVLSTPSPESYKLVLAYTVPVYPSHWGVAATELIIARTTSGSGAPVSPIVQSTRTVRAFDVPLGWADESKMQAVRAQWHRRVAGIADTQTDGKWVVLAPSGSASASRSTPLPMQLYRLSFSTARPGPPSAPSAPPSPSPSASALSSTLSPSATPSTGAKLTFVRDLSGQTAPVSAMSVADGRCVCLGRDGSVWVWDLESGATRGVEVQGPRSSFLASDGASGYGARVAGLAFGAARTRPSWEEILGERDGDDDADGASAFEDSGMGGLDASMHEGAIVFDERRVLCVRPGASAAAWIDVFRFDI